MLDRWDVPGPSTDSELEIIAFLTFLALIFVLRHILAKSASLNLVSGFRFLLSRGESFPKMFSTRILEVTLPPPLLLRI